MRITNLTEAKARIDHPEDLIFDFNGVIGVDRAVRALKAVADGIGTVTIKIDGSPALIAGRDSSGFVLTDKAGFSKTGSIGMPRTQMELEQMLYERNANQPGRLEFSKSIGRCWNQIQSLIPQSFVGYIQMDLLWSGVLIDQQGQLVFQPNKIRYSVESNSPIGRKISQCSTGIVVHSFFERRDQLEPVSITLADIQLNLVDGLMVFDCALPNRQPLEWPIQIASSIEKLVKSHGTDIDQLFDLTQLRKLQISDFAQICKRFLANKASRGDEDYSNLYDDFSQWLQEGTNSLSSAKRSKILVFHSMNSTACRSMWRIISEIAQCKLNLYFQLEKQVIGEIVATLDGVRQHEGFVADTPAGRIKLVDRNKFMRKTLS